jgi:hypothetical protein
MAWTSPKTWNTNDVLTSTDMDTYVRDNPNYLLSGRPGGQTKRDAGTDYKISTNTWADIDATYFGTTITLNATRAIVSFNGVLSGSATTIVVDFDVDVNGVRFGTAGIDGIWGVSLAGPNTNRVPISLTQPLFNLTPGANTIKMKWKCSSGTAILYSGNGTAGQDYIPSFSVYEVG